VAIQTPKVATRSAGGYYQLKPTPQSADGSHKHIKLRPDRASIKDEWVEHTMLHPVHEEIQSDGRIRRWAKIEEADNSYLRVILLEDGETVHNAFFDRRFKEKQP
jgi:hypothetical protein